MTLKKNIVASYASQIYVTVIGIALVPLYIKHMGVEAYGLVGFFAMLQVWFNLLDLGLTPTIARESARYWGGAITPLAYRQLMRSLTMIFLAIALLGGYILWLFSPEIAMRWLNANDLSQSVLIFCIQVMALCVAMRWMCGLFRGVITGAERLVWLSGYNATIATLRFVLVFVSMAVWGYTPKVFFLHQLGVACVELSALYRYSGSLLPFLDQVDIERIGWSLSPVKELLKFSLGVGLSSSVWVLVTQTDKLILSGLLPLSEYGYFTLAVLVANGILILSGPITTSITPRLTRLYAEKKYQEFTSLYRQGTQLVVVIAGAAAITIAFFSKQLLLAWTGDEELAKKAALILQLYAIGNGLLVVSSYPYLLQYAKGNLKYHSIGNILTTLILIPCIIYFALKYGAIGAAWTWMSFHLFGLLLWSAYVHGKLQPGLHKIWIFDDILKIVIPTIIAAILLNIILKNDLSRIESTEIVVLATILILTVAILSSSNARLYVFRFCGLRN